MQRLRNDYETIVMLLCNDRPQESGPACQDQRLKCRTSGRAEERKSVPQRRKDAEKRRTANVPLSASLTLRPSAVRFSAALLSERESRFSIFSDFCRGEVIGSVDGVGGESDDAGIGHGDDWRLIGGVRCRGRGGFQYDGVGCGGGVAGEDDSGNPAGGVFGGEKGGGQFGRGGRGGRCGRCGRCGRPTSCRRRHSRTRSPHR